ncbi:hypothetical protein BU23DRAFT_599967 [Bimuria novae-zelandiae CBS 107.79]|uniref:WSC domain-containing protein n=1 Tax=Bimuria novae-zelandiae CBS 107.79 TaxID=1447943 RepID=A0A6A5V7P0_9PLEO|nr:hypothetical protein BU23DRAFT_599967 [Bimuria novae-zelandiae CBS 107.79]
MKPSILVAFAALSRHAYSQGAPGFGRNPDTVKDCMVWWAGLTPEVFHEWNPDVDLNCEPFSLGQSYCILTQTKYNETQTVTSSSSKTAPTTTKTAISLGPSPTAWRSRGCYVENQAPRSPVLEQNMNPNGDAALSIPKCEQTCYRRAYNFAGVQQGNQCWCSNSVVGDAAKNQTDCNKPCTGDKNTMCGGTGFLNVFEALENRAQPSTTSSSMTGTTLKDAVSTTPAKTGTAARNGLFTF